MAIIYRRRSPPVTGYRACQHNLHCEVDGKAMKDLEGRREFCSGIWMLEKVEISLKSWDDMSVHLLGQRMTSSIAHTLYRPQDYEGDNIGGNTCSCTRVMGCSIFWQRFLLLSSATSSITEKCALTAMKKHRKSNQLKYVGVHVHGALNGTCRFSRETESGLCGNDHML